jgi:hypothetical protein
MPLKPLGNRFSGGKRRIVQVAAYQIAAIVLLPAFVRRERNANVALCLGFLVDIPKEYEELSLKLDRRAVDFRTFDGTFFRVSQKCMDVLDGTLSSAAFFQSISGNGLVGEYSASRVRDYRRRAGAPMGRALLPLNTRAAPGRPVCLPAAPHRPFAATNCRRSRSDR